MSIELAFVILAGLLIIGTVAVVHYRKAVSTYSITRKGKNWVVRDRKGRFVRITNNFFDILSLGAEL